MKIFENIRTYAWIELFIWLMVIIVIVCTVKNHQLKAQKAYKSYQIFLQDADNLIVGSSVRFLGVQIGHVTKVQIEQSSVYIKFIITQKDLELPIGATATVEGSGLGGSKALEIYPPDENVKIENIINPKDPTRLNKVMGRFDGMFRALDSILTTVSHASDELEFERNKKVKENIVFPINSISENLNNVDKKFQTLKDKIKTLPKERE